MQTARRLYVYLLSGISLGALVTGLVMLLTVLFNRLGLGPSGDLLFGGDEAIRQQLTLASALTVVSLPVWLIHWFAAERSVRPDRPNAALERTSDLRGLYVALAMGALLLAAGSGLAATLQSVILRMTGADVSYQDLGGSLALALVAGGAWAYHVWLRTRDWARGPMTDGGAWLPRTYLYVALFVGLMILLVGLVGLVQLVGQFVLDEPGFADPASGPWWAFPLASAVTAVVIGGATWLGHALYSDRLLHDPGWRGQSERPARLRLAYFVVALVATGFAVIYLVGQGAGEALAAAFGVSEADGAGRMIGVVVLPIVSAAIYAIAWWLHLRWMEGESVALESSERRGTAHRLELYPMALIGLGFGATGVAWLIGLLIDAALGADRQFLGGNTLTRQLAQVAPFALIGAAVWVWSWNGANARWRTDPQGEASSTTRRAMLLIVLAGSVLVGIVSAGFILYRAFGSVFGVSLSSNVASELSVPIGALLVAAAVALYHGVALRRDQALRAGVETSRGEPAPAAVAAMTTLLMRLSGPAGADIQATAALLGDRLPSGFVLEVLDAAEAPG